MTRQEELEQILSEHEAVIGKLLDTPQGRSFLASGKIDKDIKDLITVLAILKNKQNSYQLHGVDVLAKIKEDWERDPNANFVLESRIDRLRKHLDDGGDVRTFIENESK
jgi:hypothetical protein